MRSRIKPPPELSLFQRGPMRAIRDHKSRDIRIETTKDHDAGEGIIVCRVPMSMEREAQAIVALHDLIRAAHPFAALGIMVMAGDPEDPLIHHEEDISVTVGDVHRVTDALARACIAPKDRLAMPWHEPDKGPQLKR